LFSNPIRKEQLETQQRALLANNARRASELATTIASQEAIRTIAQEQALLAADVTKVRGPQLTPTASSTNLPDTTSAGTTATDTTSAGTTATDTTVTPASIALSNEVVTARRIAAIRDQTVTASKNQVRLLETESRFIANPKLETLNGFVNPVQQPYSTSDTFGAPRSGHRHEGIDIFAERGTPVRATVDGVLRDVKKTPIGGRIAYVTSPDGTYYYYAHLDKWAPNVVDGKSVIAGEIIGFVGRTGNAEATPPHVHFEIHPLGGAPISPFFTIDAVRSRNKALMQKWTVPIGTLCSRVASDSAARTAALAAWEAAGSPSTTQPPTTKPRPSPPSTYVSLTTIAPGICKPTKANDR
jgi:murein DD-endopeptidase MepM/ murein hydrolase activator NlpD